MIKTKSFQSMNGIIKKTPMNLYILLNFTQKYLKQILFWEEVQGNAGGNPKVMSDIMTPLSVWKNQIDKAKRNLIT